MANIKLRVDDERHKQLKMEALEQDKTLEELCVVDYLKGQIQKDEEKEEDKNE